MTFWEGIKNRIGKVLRNFVTCSGMLASVADSHCLSQQADELTSTAVWTQVITLKPCLFCVDNKQGVVRKNR